MPKDFIRQLQKIGLISSTSLWKKDQLNGVNHKVTVSDIYQQYKENHLPTISESSRLSKISRCNRFLKPIFDLKMADLNPQVMSEFIKYSKEQFDPAGRRCNFHKELKDLKSIFSWYIDNYDFRYANPIRPSHLKLSVIKEPPEKQRQIDLNHVKLFISNLKPYYRDIALIQLYCAGRIGEVAGIQVKNIDLQNRVLKIKEVLVWIKGKPKVKNCPKNGKTRSVYINDTMMEIFLRHLKEHPISCPFLFHKNEEPLRYNAIAENYNKAWCDSGLSQYSGTHQIRYASAQMARRITGSIDAAMAVTGHTSIKMAEHYSQYENTELNKSSVQKVESAFNDLSSIDADEI